MRLRVLPPALLVVAALVLFAAGCLGGDDGDGGDGEEITTTTTNEESNLPPKIEEDEAQETSGDTTVILDPLSTFESKDPFVSQDVVVVSQDGSENTSGGDNTNDGGGSATTTTGAGATTTTNPSDVANHLHSLRVLSIDVMNDTPLVTFEVDDTVYEDREEGDVEATSWGEVKVVAIDADGQTVTLLHGSETRVLGVGQEFLK